jgi:hypothetical protein
MGKERLYEIVIHLDNIHDLFTTPTGDPFSAKVRFVSGIEFIKSEFKPQLLRREARTRLTIFLPKADIESDLADKTRNALTRYCRFKIQQNKNVVVALQRDALKSLLIGIFVLTSGLFLVDEATFLPRFFSTLISYGLDIAFWVLLWRPVDFFLFELSAYRRESKIYQHIMEMEIAVCEENQS